MKTKTNPRHCKGTSRSKTATALRALAFSAIFGGNAAFGDSVKFDEIFTQKRSLRLDVALYYANVQGQNGIFAPVFVGVGGSSPSTLPALLNVAQSNQDYLNFSLNLRYGITEDLQIFASPSFYYRHANVTDLDLSTQNDYDFNSFNAGLVWQLKREDAYPSLLVGVTPFSVESTPLQTLETKKSKIDYFKSYSFFATAFYTVDPLVFLIQGGYRLSLERKLEGKRLKIGDVISISPTVYFSVNPYASLSAGIRYEYKFKDRIDGKAIAHQGSSVSYLFGVSYEFNPSLMMSLDVSAMQTNAYANNGVNLLFSYKIK